MFSQVDIHYFRAVSFGPRYCLMIGRCIASNLDNECMCVDVGTCAEVSGQVGVFFLHSSMTLTLVDLIMLYRHDYHQFIDIN